MILTASGPAAQPHKSPHLWVLPAQVSYTIVLADVEPCGQVVSLF